jgi:hypothetical protein
MIARPPACKCGFPPILLPWRVRSRVFRAMRRKYSIPRAQLAEIEANSSNLSRFRFSVAPMIGWNGLAMAGGALWQLGNKF